ncbi:hypothetical protein BO223_03155 [Faecalibaculum rodentium]|uniref:Uncharacterized protein n=1 Tax=Faecalibaculum rodentium TaxID=1702221 RepID=A0A1Q9YM04_9FIRM|nr:hypothetical protein BO223_03155 [Faecalibaculum rodentium]
MRILSGLPAAFFAFLLICRVICLLRQAGKPVNETTFLWNGCLQGTVCKWCFKVSCILFHAGIHFVSSV